MQQNVDRAHKIKELMHQLSVILAGPLMGAQPHKQAEKKAHLLAHSLWPDKPEFSIKEVLR